MSTHDNTIKKEWIHKDLAAGRWARMSLAEQLGHIGSEVSRALNWQAKGNDDYSQKASARAIELILLSLQGQCTESQYREVACLHETVADYFYGENRYGSTPALLRKYFDQFAMLVVNKKSGN